MCYVNSFGTNDDLPPTDLQCVYSALKLIQVTSVNFRKIPVCTNDEALQWKALQVIHDPPIDLGVVMAKSG